MHILTCLRRGIVLGTLLLAGALTAVMAAEAEAELQLDAVLVWGTNGPQTENPKLKALRVEIRQKLQAVFKWTDYYEVDRKALKVAAKQTRKVRLSPKCEIAVENLGRSTIEVRLYGEGKLVVRKKQTLTPGELLVLAGEDRNDTAWFVVISLKPA